MTAMIELPDGIGDGDLEALQDSVTLVRASGRAQADQIDAKLQDGDPWIDVALFCSYTCQICALKLRPWEVAPLHVGDPEEPEPGEEIAARLLRQMLQLGISRYAPDPLGAIAVAERDATT